MHQGTASRAQAFHDKTGRTYTAGGLNCHNLVMGKDGQIHSKKKVRQGLPPALAAQVQAQKMVGKLHRGEFTQFARKGTAAYKKVQKLAKKLM